MDLLCLLLQHCKPFHCISLYVASLHLHCSSWYSIVPLPLLAVLLAEMGPLKRTHEVTRKQKYPHAYHEHESDSIRRTQITCTAKLLMLIQHGQDHGMHLAQGLRGLGRSGAIGSLWQSE